MSDVQPSAPPTLRAFVAVFPPATLAASLAAEAKKLKLARGSVRWTSPEQIHLTLNFLGSIPAARLSGFSAAIGAACAQAAPHTLEAAGLGAFPSPARPRIIWAGLRGGVQPLRQLKEALDSRLHPLGYVPDTRDFHPHLTIGRVLRLQPADRDKLRLLIEQFVVRSFGHWPIERVALMRSQLSPSGAKYSELESFAIVRKP
jgi:2'-5' RNA ligase